MDGVRLKPRRIGWRSRAWSRVTSAIDRLRTPQPVVGSIDICDVEIHLTAEHPKRPGLWIASCRTCGTSEDHKLGADAQAAGLQHQGGTRRVRERYMKADHESPDTVEMFPGVR